MKDIIPAKIFRTQLEVIQRHSSELIRDNAEALHDVRVAVLRLEFASEIFSQFIPLSKMLYQQLKSSRDLMGEVRDLDVLLKHPNISHPRIRRKMESLRQQKRKKLVRHLRSKSYQQMLQKLSDLPLKGRALDKKEIDKKLFKVAKKAYDWTHHIHSPKDYHKTRGAYKELRYATEFFDGAYKNGLGKYIKIAKRLQDILGDRQDAVSAIQTLYKIQSRQNKDIIQGLITLQKHTIKSCEAKFKKKNSDANLFFTLF